MLVFPRSQLVRVCALPGGHSFCGPTLACTSPTPCVLNPAVITVSCQTPCEQPLSPRGGGGGGTGSGGVSAPLNAASPGGAAKRAGGGEGFGGTRSARSPRRQLPQGSDITYKNAATPAARTLAAKKDRPSDTKKMVDPRVRVVAASAPCPSGSERGGGGGNGDAAAEPGLSSSVTTEERAWTLKSEKPCLEALLFCFRGVGGGEREGKGVNASLHNLVAYA